MGQSYGLEKYASELSHVPDGNFECLLKNELFPSALEKKKAVIVIIPKPGKDVHGPKNYQPITGKVSEKIILKRFVKCR